MLRRVCRATMADELVRSDDMCMSLWVDVTRGTYRAFTGMAGRHHAFGWSALSKGDCQLPPSEHPTLPCNGHWHVKLTRALPTDGRHRLNQKYDRTSPPTSRFQPSMRMKKRILK